MYTAHALNIVHLYFDDGTIGDVFSEFGLDGQGRVMAFYVGVGMMVRALFL